MGFNKSTLVARGADTQLDASCVPTGHTKRRATIGRPRGNGRPDSPHSQRCHRSERSMFTWGALYVRCSSCCFYGVLVMLRCLSIITYV